MLLLEADGKALLRDAGIPTPAGVRVRAGQPVPPLTGDGPWMVKAQVPVGGRGKAGGIERVERPDAVAPAVAAMLGRDVKGCAVREVLVEAAVNGAERYLSMMVDASQGGVRLLYSAAGGVDIESNMGHVGDAFDALVPLDPAAIEAAIDRLVATAPTAERRALGDVARRMARLFQDEQLLLLEVNPLFAAADGTLVAGDAKVVVDMNVAATHPRIHAVFDAGRILYPDAWRKLSEDFDFIEVDPAGQIGLVTTGAGLSMMVIDELVGSGLRPFNFCDMRTGQMRGSPARLLRILDWLAEARDVRVVLVNIFAGITDLAEFSQLLVDALQQRPAFRRPIVARLVGNGEAAARTLLAGHAELGLMLEPDLEQAIALAGRLAAAGASTAGGPLRAA